MLRSKRYKNILRDQKEKRGTIFWTRNIRQELADLDSCLTRANPESNYRISSRQTCREQKEESLGFQRCQFHLESVFQLDHDKFPNLNKQFGICSIRSQADIIKFILFFSIPSWNKNCVPIRRCSTFSPAKFSQNIQ